MAKVTTYTVLKATTVEKLQELVNDALPDLQPHGSMVADIAGRAFMQPMVDAGGLVVYDGMEIDVEPEGEFATTTTFTVDEGEITKIVMS